MWIPRSALTRNDFCVPPRLHLAGDFHPFYETERPTANPHLMRCMLTTNHDAEHSAEHTPNTAICPSASARHACILAPLMWATKVEQRFANGTQGRRLDTCTRRMRDMMSPCCTSSLANACIRLLCWHPCGDQQQKRRKCLQASHPDLSCRFVKEGSLGKTQLLADIDHVERALDNAWLSSSCAQQSAPHRKKQNRGHHGASGKSEQRHWATMHASIGRRTCLRPYSENLSSVYRI